MFCRHKIHCRTVLNFMFTVQAEAPYREWEGRKGDGPTWIFFQGSLSYATAAQMVFMIGIPAS